jgi:hypothetical protein
MFRRVVIACVIAAAIEWTGLVVGAANVPDPSEPRHVV